MVRPGSRRPSTSPVRRDQLPGATAVDAAVQAEVRRREGDPVTGARQEGDLLRCEEVVGAEDDAGRPPEVSATVLRPPEAVGRGRQQGCRIGEADGHVLEWLRPVAHGEAAAAVGARVEALTGGQVDRLPPLAIEGHVERRGGGRLGDRHAAVGRAQRAVAVHPQRVRVLRVDEHPVVVELLVRSDDRPRRRARGAPHQRAGHVQGVLASGSLGRDHGVDVAGAGWPAARPRVDARHRLRRSCEQQRQSHEHPPHDPSPSRTARA